MNDEKENIPPSISISQATLVGKPESESVDSDLPQASSSLQAASSLPDEKFLRDDSTTVYSDFSTLSPNSAMSNPAGPRRVIGDLLSSAGSSVKRR